MTVAGGIGAGAAQVQAQAIAQAALGKYSGGGGGQGCVLLISNMNEELTQPDHLFILFGVYGDVQVTRAETLCGDDGVLTSSCCRG